MNVLDQYDKLQRNLSDLKDQSSKTEGKLESLRDELKNRGFDTIEKAVKWLGKAKQEQVSLENEIQIGLGKAEELMEKVK